MLLRFGYVQHVNSAQTPLKVCALWKLVLHSRGISILLDCTELPGGRVFLEVAHRLGFFCPDNKEAPVWGLEHRSEKALTLE